MAFNVSKFTAGIVGLSVGAIISAAMFPVIGGIEIPDSIANAGAIESMYNVLLILFPVGLVMGGVYLFLTRK